jgi:hypothetical protein
MIQTYPQIGHDLIKHIPRLEQVAEIIAYQDKLFNGQGVPADNRRGAEIPVGARILKVALDYDKLLQSRQSNTEVLEDLQKRGNLYDPAVVDALKTILTSETRYEMKRVRISELIPNMILAEDLISVKGVMLVPNGQEITQSLCIRLKNFHDGGSIREPIKILMPVQPAFDGGDVAHAAR